MGGVEHLRQLDAHAGQAVDVEEAAPVDLVRRGAPPGEPVVLPLEQPVQPLATLVALPRAWLAAGPPIGCGRSRARSRNAPRASSARRRMPSARRTRADGGEAPASSLRPASPQHAGVVGAASIGKRCAS